MKKISIIIPIYNAEKYLVKCLDSVVKQTYKNLEIILVDDGSKDNSKLICKRYVLKDDRIKLICNTNHGVGYSRNCGIKKANGDGIIFIDADDHVKLNYIEKMVEFFDNNDLVICNVYDFYEKYDKYIFNEVNLKDLTGDWKNDIFLLGNKIFYPHLKLYKTEIIKYNNIYFPEDMVTAEDQIFNYRYLKYVKKYKFINEALYIYSHRENMSLSRLRTKISFESEIKSLIFKETYFKEMNILKGNKMIMQQIFFLVTKYIYFDDEINSFNKYKDRVIYLEKFIPDNQKFFETKEKNLCILMKNKCIRSIYFFSILNMYKIKIRYYIKGVFFKLKVRLPLLNK